MNKVILPIILFTVVAMVSGCSKSEQTTLSKPPAEHKSISAILNESDFSGWELVTATTGYSGQYRIAQMCTVWSGGPPKGTYFPDDNPISFEFEFIPGYEQKTTCIEDQNGTRYVLRHKKKI